MEGEKEVDQDEREVQGGPQAQSCQQEDTNTAESVPASEAAGARPSSPNSDRAREDGPSLEEREEEEEEHVPAPVDTEEGTWKQCQEALSNPVNEVEREEEEEEEREGEGGGEKEKERDTDHHVTMVPSPQEGDQEEEEEEEEGRSGERPEEAMEENEEVEAEAVAGETAAKMRERQVAVEGSGPLSAESSSSAQERRAERMRRLRELHMRRVSGYV